LPLAVGVPNHFVVTLDDLLVVRPDESVSGLRAIKANPSKPSVDAMLALLDKLRVIDATGVLGVARPARAAEPLGLSHLVEKHVG
jgi:hypothetical protein